jgi:hypothetical protein
MNSQVYNMQKKLEVPILLKTILFPQFQIDQHKAETPILACFHVNTIKPVIKHIGFTGRWWVL